MQKRSLSVTCVGGLLFLLACPLYGSNINYLDGFEGAGLDPFWAIEESFGTVGVSSNQSHSGSQSAALVSESGGQRSIALTHSFGEPMKGTASIWFYDVAPEQETLYEWFSLYNAADPNGSRIGVSDYDAKCYNANAFSTGPNASCGIYPQVITAPVNRSAGWHLFEIAYLQNEIRLSLDGQLIHSLAGNYTFDSVRINMAGPLWRPNTSAYFDDFSMQAESASIPEPATSLLACVGVVLLAARRWRYRR